MAVYHTLEDHQQLLELKGYMGDAFKASHKMGYWLKEFREQYDQALYQAAENGVIQKFPMTIYGNFNESLERVKFLLRYEYNPKKDVLSLKSIIATLGITSKPYLLHRSGDLPQAEKVFAFLSKDAILNLQYNLVNTLQKEFYRDREPANDYKPEEDPDNRRQYKRDYHKMRLRR